MSPNQTDRKKLFNELASSWDSQYAKIETALFFESLMTRLELSTGQRVLDTGTGTGILIPYLSKGIGSTGQVVAIDFAEKMVKESKRKYSNLTNVNIELKNVEELDYPSDYFNAVTCFGVFPHIQNKKKALANIGRVLKPSGRLLIAHMLGRKELARMHKKERSVVVDDVLPTKEATFKLLKDRGFKVTFFEDKPKGYICLSVKQ